MHRFYFSGIVFLILSLSLGSLIIPDSFAAESIYTELADIAITSGSSPITIEVGETADIFFTFTNYGPDTATNIHSITKIYDEVYTLHMYHSGVFFGDIPSDCILRMMGDNHTPSELHLGHPNALDMSCGIETTPTVLNPFEEKTMNFSILGNEVGSYFIQIGIPRNVPHDPEADLDLWNNGFKIPITVVAAPSPDWSVSIQNTNQVQSTVFPGANLDFNIQYGHGGDPFDDDTILTIEIDLGTGAVQGDDPQGVHYFTYLVPTGCVEIYHEPTIAKIECGTGYYEGRLNIGANDKRFPFSLSLANDISTNIDNASVDASIWPKDQTDANPENNEFSFDFYIDTRNSSPDLVATLSPKPTSAKPGDQIQFQVDYANLGGTTADVNVLQFHVILEEPTNSDFYDEEGKYFTLVIPSGCVKDYASAWETSLTCFKDAGMQLSNGESGTINFSLSLDNEISDFDLITVYASISGLSIESNYMNNDDDWDIIIDKSSDPTPEPIDTDGDGIPDTSDACPYDSLNDVDGDGVCGNVDSCPYEYGTLSNGCSVSLPEPTTPPTDVKVSVTIVDEANIKQGDEMKVTFFSENLTPYNPNNPVNAILTVSASDGLSLANPELLNFSGPYGSSCSTSGNDFTCVLIGLTSKRELPIFYNVDGSDWSHQSISASLYSEHYDPSMSNNMASNSFTIIGDTTPTPTPTTPQSCDISSEDSGIFTVSGYNFDYSIIAGNIMNMFIDQTINSLVVQITSCEKGQISLDLPRNLIDSKKQNGSDDVFIVLIDGIEVEYPPQFAGQSDSRVVTINFEKGNSDIEIIGTATLQSNTAPTPDSERFNALPAYVQTQIQWWANEENNISDRDFIELIQVAIYGEPSDADNNKVPNEISPSFKEYAEQYARGEISNDQFLDVIEQWVRGTLDNSELDEEGELITSTTLTPETPLQPKDNDLQTLPTIDDNKETTTTPSNEQGGGCLIATAAYGTELAPQVQFLREIRDNTVMSTASGAAFMTTFNQFYYSFSPYIADLERENPLFQEAVRAYITPMISTLSIMTLADDGNDAQVLGLGISVILLNIGMYFGAPFGAFIIYRKLKN